MILDKCVTVADHVVYDVSICYVSNQVLEEYEELREEHYAGLEERPYLPITKVRISSYCTWDPLTTLRVRLRRLGQTRYTTLHYHTLYS